MDSSSSFLVHNGRLPLDSMNRISLDTETTGVDHYHGAAPFLVTICDEEWNNTYWEWDVNPQTRKVSIPTRDLEEIVQRIEEADEIVLQNSKFDATTLTLLQNWPIEWPWEKTRDTLLAAHLLESNKRKDLNALALRYLDIDISQCEEELDEAVKEARSIAKGQDWRLAKVDLPEMPSAKEKTWKFDLWVPRAVAKRKLPGWKKEWLTVTSKYANSDSSVTLGIYQQQIKILEQRGLLPIYEMRLKLLPIIFEMERGGVVGSHKRMDELYAMYEEEAAKAGRICENIAENMGYCLQLPKAGSNNSLTDFVFNGLKLEPIYQNKKKKTKAPDLDKRALESYKETLPPKSKGHLFISKLREKRQRDTACSYMRGYRKFARQLPGATSEWFLIHPSLNITGTDTLRFSSSNPNEQNISKQGMFEGDKKNLRYIFGPASGREWWSLDAKNIELRIPGYESGEKELINLFEHPDEPPYYGSEHLLNFHTIYPDIWAKELEEVGLEKVGPHCKKKYAASWYQWCKNFGFAVGYGAVDRDDGEGTADRSAHKAGSQALVKARFAKKEQLNKKCIDLANRDGYVETIPDTSVCPEHGYPLLCTRNNWGRIKPTVPLNYHVQGTAMWWMCMAMIRCHAKLKEWRDKQIIRASIALQVHDELVFDFPKAAHPKENQKNSNLKFVLQLADLMTKCGDGIGIPTPVGIEYNPTTWSEGITIQ